MSNHQFPKPIDLPTEISEARQLRHQQLIKSSLIGILARLAIIALEIGGVILFGSSALLMDAIASSIDVITSCVLVACIRFAARPPDINHPFGHGRIEPLAGLQMGIVLIVVGFGMALYQVFEYFTVTHPHEIEKNLWIIPLVAVILLEIAYRTMMAAAKKYHSTALAADASHFRIDSLSSLFALIALFLASLFPAWSQPFDHMGAFAIVALMVALGFFVSKENLNQLMDRVPAADFFAKVKQAALNVEGVLGTEKIRIQLYGPDAHVDIDVEVDPQLSVERAHEISQFTRAAIQKEWPFVRDVVVHIEPYYPGDHE